MGQLQQWVENGMTVQPDQELQCAERVDTDGGHGNDDWTLRDGQR